MSFWNCFSCLRFPNDEVITKLDYTSCTLQELPQEFWQYEKTLEILILSSNHLTELPHDLLNFQLLKILKLNDNQLEQLPNNIGILRQLQQLDLSRNSLKSIPDSIKTCKNLTHLDLSLNNIQRLPDTITSLITLEELLLNETYLEFLPANIGRLNNLKILELRSNNLITLPKSIGLLTALQRLDIGANEFTELPEVIGNLNQLRELWIDFNKICRIPITVSNLCELIHFEANSNQLISLPNEISNWRNLQVMSVSVNEIEDIPFSIGMLKQLVTLKCDNNQLKELPDSICHLVNMEELILNNNSIMRLPNTIGMLKKLKFLELDENILRRLPNELSNCQNLTVLSVHSNQLNELPDNIGILINLRVLNIINNMISYLPVSILNLQNLHALWLYENQTQPLVPLQYYDTNQLYLTCFLLPQKSNEKKIPLYVLDNEGNYDNMEIQNEENSNISERIIQQQLLNTQNQLIDGNNSLNYDNKPTQWLYFQQRQQLLLNRNSQISQKVTQNNIVTSPLKKICFADDNTIHNNTKFQDGIEAKNVKLDQNLSSITTDASITSKLMRSPTPYPKELRIMAKYIRNQQQSHHSLDTSANISENLTVPKTSQINDQLIESHRKTFYNDKIYLNKINCDLNQSQTNITSSSLIPHHQQNVILDYQQQQQLIYEASMKQQQEQQHQLSNALAINNPKSNSYDIVDYKRLDKNTVYNQRPSTVITSQTNPNTPIQYHIQMNNKQQFQQQKSQIEQNFNGVYQTYNTEDDMPNNNNCSYVGYPSTSNYADVNLVHYLTVVDPSSLSPPPTNSLINSSENSNLVNGIDNKQLSSHQNQQSILPINYLIQNNNLKQQQQQQIINNTTNPPPYYVAKNYTKKSQEDLLNYDTLRKYSLQQKQIKQQHLVQQQQHEQDENLITTTKNNNDLHKDVTDSGKKNFDNSIRNSLDKININNENKQIQDLSYLNNNIKNNDVSKYSSDESNYTKLLANSTNLNSDTISETKFNIEEINDLNDDCSENLKFSSKELIDTNISESDYVTDSLDFNQKKLNSQKWLFGTHKNPTVKQVMIKKEPDMGFEIKEFHHQGIFVSRVAPNTSAGSLLKVDDKILDVDGYDFTKLNYDGANQILIDSGPILSIMLSRK